MANLEITALDAWALREPVSRRLYTVVRLRTKSGLSGYGECSPVPTPDVGAARRAVVGHPATSYEAARLALRDTPRVLPAINAAMLDLVGKSAQAPVFQVLGGPTRNRARALASLQGTTDADLAAGVKTLHAAGFRAVDESQSCHDAPDLKDRALTGKFGSPIQLLGPLVGRERCG